jgi:Ca-activated chloride channel family protein
MRKTLAVFATLLILAGACSAPRKQEASLPAPPPPPPVAPPPAAESVASMKLSSVMTGGQVGSPGFMPAQRADAGFHTEEYGRFEENPFLRPSDNPLSTFSIDVDRASYANVRRFLRDGQRPPRDAVRIEEMVNYFTYDYDEPAGADPVSITTELAACPWNEQHKLLLIGLQTRRIDTRDLPPSNLVFLVDTSGSMQSPAKLPLVKSALRLLVDQLRPEDRVSIVAYAGSAGLVLKPTRGSDRAAIHEAIDAFEAGGSTAGAEGIVLAYEVAKDNFLRNGNNRVILATDGDFNVGVTSDGELERLIEEKRRDGIFLTVLGFGSGNIKDSKMELLADKGNGNYSYIDTIAEARKSLVQEMGATLVTVAKDVKVQVEMNPAHVGAYRLIGYENRLLRAEDFNNDAKDAGELGAGHSVTALYEIVPPGGAVPNGSVDPLKYQTRSAATGGAELATVKIRYKDPDADTSRLMTHVVATNITGAPSQNFRVASSVAQLGMLLRDSPHKGNASYQAIERIEVGDFAELVRLAAGTSGRVGS